MIQFPKYLCLFSVALLIGTICVAQASTSIGSLRKQLNALRDSTRVDSYNKLSLEYIAAENKDSAEYYAKVAYDEAIKLNYIHGIAVSFFRKSQIARHFDDDFIKMEEMAKKSLWWYEKTANKAESDDAYYHFMDGLFAQSKFKEAMYYLEERHSKAIESGDTVKILKALQRIYAVSRLTGDYEKSFVYTRKAYELALKARNKIWISATLYNMGQLHMQIDDYAGALSYFRQVIQMDDEDTRNEAFLVVAG